jgi:hypothetical protein
MKVSLRDAVAEFDADQVSEIEYGINDEDAAKCLRGMFTALGIEWDEDALFLYGRLASAEDIAANLEQKRKYAADRAARRAAHPEEAALEDLLEANIEATNNALIDQIADTIFKPAPFFRALTEEPT